VRLVIKLGMHQTSLELISKECRSKIIYCHRGIKKCGSLLVEGPGNVAKNVVIRVIRQGDNTNIIRVAFPQRLVALRSFDEGSVWEFSE